MERKTQSVAWWDSGFVYISLRAYTNKAESLSELTSILPEQPGNQIRIFHICCHKEQILIQINAEQEMRMDVSDLKPNFQELSKTKQVLSSP